MNHIDPQSVELSRMTYPYNMPDEWDQSTEGDQAIYTTDPALIPVSWTPRIIYELRQDIENLNNQILDFVERLDS